LNIDLPEEEDMDDHETGYYTDIIVTPKQLIYWANFVTRRRKRRA